MIILRICLISAIIIHGHSVEINLKRAAPLTESLGQEIIELNSPVKDLPANIDEGPSAEVEDNFDLKRKKNVNVIIPLRDEEDRIKAEKDEEEARIEKEIAEIYKDNADYGDDTKGNATESNTTVTTESEHRTQFEMINVTNVNDTIDGSALRSDISSAKNMADNLFKTVVMILLILTVGTRGN